MSRIEARSERPFEGRNRDRWISRAASVIVVSVAWLVLFQSPAVVQARPASAPQEVQKPASAPNQTQTEGSLPTAAGTDPLIVERLSNIDKALTEIRKSSKEPPLWPAAIAVGGSLIGAFIGAWIAFGTQKRALKAQSDEAERKGKLEIANLNAEWQLKQLSELYGPLHALLRQSNALYLHMNHALVAKSPDRFKFEAQESAEGFQPDVLKIKVGENWEVFRTVQHLGEVYGKNLGVDQYFDGLVAIGKRIVDVIEQKAGFVRDNSSELLKTFGQYLAHYSVLEQIHKAALPKAPDAASGRQDSTSPPIQVDSSAAFPLKIQGLVNGDYEALVDDLAKWRRKAE